MRPSLPGPPSGVPLRMRLMRASDLPLANIIRTAAGWNQTLADWRRLRRAEPRGCFVAEWSGVPAGTVTTTRHGPDLAWIGMLLVHPDYRGRGIGTALMEHALDYLERRRVSCIKLDATPQGRPIYERLGFRDEWTLQRWAADPLPESPLCRQRGLRFWTRADESAVQRLDTEAFGANRTAFLAASLCHSVHALVRPTSAGRIAGFGLARPGARATYLGPIVATSVSTAHRIAGALLQPLVGTAVYWDIPDHQSQTRAWAASAGFQIQRPLIRMFRGENRHPGHPQRIFGITGPETG